MAETLKTTLKLDESNNLQQDREKDVMDFITNTSFGNEILMKTRNQLDGDIEKDVYNSVFGDKNK